MLPSLGMLLVALVFGELGSHYPIAGALYQYGKRSVGPRYGWWVGWIYGLALLVTVASVDTGVVGYVAALAEQPVRHGARRDEPLRRSSWSRWCCIVIQTMRQHGRCEGDGPGQPRSGVYVETSAPSASRSPSRSPASTTGSASCSPRRAPRREDEPARGRLRRLVVTGAALVAVLAPVYIFYGFESAGDIAEETKNASRQVPRAMRSALVYGGIASFVLVAGLLLATPAGPKGYAGRCRSAAASRSSSASCRSGCRTCSCCCRLHRLLLLRHRRAGRRVAAALLLRPRPPAARQRLAAPGVAAVPHPGQRAARRRDRAGALHAARQREPRRRTCTSSGSCSRRGSTRSPRSSPSASPASTCRSCSR